MENETSLRRYLGVLAFAVFLLVPSFDTIMKYGGLKGIAAYFVAGTALLLLLYKFALPVFQNKLSEKHANILAIITLAGLIAIVAIGYPLANSGRFGAGSDADEALITAASDLLKGNYPYTQQTYLGNPISPMPGAVIYALPFVITGIFSFQNVFWFVALFFVIRHFAGSSQVSLGLLWVVLIFSPTVLWNFVTGSDYATNTIYIVSMMWLLVRMVSDATTAEWQRILPAIFLGIGLSSRSNFFLPIPLLLSVLVQNAGWRPAIKYLLISAFSFLLVTVPFWLYDPTGFTPFTVQASKIRDMNDVLPYANILVPGSALVLTIVLSLRKLSADCGVFFRNCAIVQLFVLLFICTLSSIKAGHPDIFLRQAGYGMFTLFFGVIGLWIIHFGRGIAPANKIES